MLKCKKCNTELGIEDFTRGNYKEVFDVDLKKIGLFCRKHGQEVESELKKERFIEEYRGSKIYGKEGKYIPYWESNYYFKSIESVKERLDISHVAIINKEIIGILNM